MLINRLKEKLKYGENERKLEILRDLNWDIERLSERLREKEIVRMKEGLNEWQRIIERVLDQKKAYNWDV